MVKVVLLLAFVCFVTGNVNGFSFASYYSNNAVLQRAPYKASVWGYVADGSTVSVAVKDKQYKSVSFKVDWSNSSIWKITFDPQPASDKPIDLSFTQISSTGQQSTIQLKNVLFGDVWVCSGQSNMNWNLGGSFNGSQELEIGLTQFPNIRIFQVLNQASSTPISDFSASGIKFKWLQPLSNYLTQFSAVCWYYGKIIHQTYGIPIGLIQSSYGGTNIERWSSPDALRRCNGTKASADSNIWNIMINPLTNMTIYGVLWYQGESNTGYNLNQYGCIFSEMIDDWRNKWFVGTGGYTNSTFPFGYVQIANIYTETASVGTYPVLRWQQTAEYGYAPNPRQKNVFMTTAVDLVDNDHPNNAIHPRYKQDVGYRLALSGLTWAYGNSSIESSPPRLDSISYSNSVAKIQFVSDFEPIEFEIRDSKSGFDVCCDSTQCLTIDTTPWAAIQAVSVNGSYVSFNLPSNCKSLKYVRYSWRQKPCEFKQCLLYSARSQLPVYPFIAKVN